jgi:cytochrome c553
LTPIAALLLAAAPAAAQTTAPSSVATLAATCALCHGAENRGVEEIEGLAAMSRREFIEEMRELHDEPREYRLMSTLAGAYSEAQIRALAEHFAAQPGGERRQAEEHEESEAHDDD